MDIRTAEDKTAILESLLNEARIEANELRLRIERYRRIIASTRLVMGHEFKRPTTAIAGYLELAREDVQKAGCREALALIDQAHAECALINDLNGFYLELLKIDCATGVPLVDRVDIGQVIKEAIEQAPDRLRARTRVSVVAPEQLPALSLNRNALKLIVLNLLENALNYSPDDRIVHVEVEASRDLRGPGDGELLKMRVIDEGNGIASDDLKRIFMPFVRLSEGKLEGSGLGLTLVRSLVDMCDGEISIRSEQGKGTTVFVTLPIVADSASAGVVQP